MDTALRSTPPGYAGVPLKPWGIPAILAVSAIPFGLFMVGLFTDSPDELTTGEIFAGLIGTLVLKDALFIGSAAAFALGRYRQGWSGLGLRPFSRDLWWLPIVAAAGALLGVIVYGIVLIALGFDQPEQEEVQSLFDSRAALPLVAFGLIIMAPLSEEIFFRGFIFPGLMRPLGVYGAMAITGIMFGGLHVTGTSTIGLLIPFSAIGALFCWLYYRTGSLWPSILAHLLFNSVGFIANAAGGAS